MSHIPIGTYKDKDLHKFIEYVKLSVLERLNYGAEWVESSNIYQYGEDGSEVVEFTVEVGVGSASHEFKCWYNCLDDIMNEYNKGQRMYDKCANKIIDRLSTIYLNKIFRPVKDDCTDSL